MPVPRLFTPRKGWPELQRPITRGENPTDADDPFQELEVTPSGLVVAPDVLQANDERANSLASQIWSDKAQTDINAATAGNASQQTDIGGLNTRLTALENAKSFVRVVRASAQTLGNGQFTALVASSIFQAVGGDIAWDSASRLTAQTAGTYIFGGNLCFAKNGSGTRFGAIWVNGATLASFDLNNSTGTDFWCVPPVAAMVLNPGHYVQLVGWQSSGGNLQLVTGSGPLALWMARLT